MKRRGEERSVFGATIRAAVSCAIALPMVVAFRAQPASPPVPAVAPALYVSGTQIVDSTHTPIQLNGVDRSGTEYACAQGWGIFDGPNDAASIVAMATWHIHVVRVPLNEDCWLGINGVNPAYGGPNYRNAIRDYVGLLEAARMNVILELHISAPGSQLALTQQKMPDADHSPTFWRGVARVFGSDRAVMFDLFNEPHDILWSCWRDGCLVDGSWQATGLQTLVTTVRQAGARNVLMIGGTAGPGTSRSGRRTCRRIRSVSSWRRGTTTTSEGAPTPVAGSRWSTAWGERRRSCSVRSVRSTARMATSIP